MTDGQGRMDWARAHSGAATTKGQVRLGPVRS